MHIQDLALGFLQDRPFQLSQCAISTTAPIDFKEQLKATVCDRSGKPSNLRLEQSKWHLHLKHFDLSPTAAPTRCPAINTGTLFLLPLPRSIHELLHTSPRTSVTIFKLYRLIEGGGKKKKRRNNRISSTRSLFGSIQEAGEVVRCKDSAVTILNRVQMSEDDRQREK